MIVAGIYGIIPYALHFEYRLFVLMNRIMVVGGTVCFAIFWNYGCGLDKVGSVVATLSGDHVSRDVQILNSLYVNNLHKGCISFAITLVGAWGAFVSCFENCYRSYLDTFGWILISAGLLRALSEIAEEIGSQKGVEMCKTKLKRDNRSLTYIGTMAHKQPNYSHQ